jgi:YD repeat-containing protein
MVKVDEYARIRRAHFVDGLGIKAIGRQMYDAASNVTSIIDPDGNRTSYSFDAVYNLVQETDPFNHSSSYSYDADYQLTSSTDKVGNVISYGYDSVGDLTGETWKTGLTTMNRLVMNSVDPMQERPILADVPGIADYHFRGRLSRSIPLTMLP